MLTVLMTTCNGEKYLEEQLNSLLSQTYRDFRILISDDASTDGTRRILKEYRESFPEKIEVHFRKEATGSAAKHFLTMIARLQNSGALQDIDHLALCDQDDVWHPDKLELEMDLMNALEDSHGTQTPILIHTDLSLCDAKGIVKEKSMAKAMEYRKDFTGLNYRLVQNYVTGNTVVMNRSLLEKLVIPEHCMMHDWWLSLVAQTVGRLEYLDVPTVNYRQHSANVMGSRKHFTGEEIRENYRNMFRQARCLRDAYGEEMTKENRDILDAFLGLQNLSRIEKIKAVDRYMFFRSPAWMTIGLMLKI